MYTLRIPGARLYVINSLDLIPVVQRQWRTLLFPPIQVKAAKAAMGASDNAIKVLEKDMITDKGFVPGMVKVTHPTMVGSLLAFNSFPNFFPAGISASSPKIISSADTQAE